MLRAAKVMKQSKACKNFSKSCLTIVAETPIITK
nr:MAG TPA: hypothetical protein [Herelleviridae sp.]